MNKRLSQNDSLPPELAKMRQLIIFVSLIGFVATTILAISSVQDKNTTEAIINSSSAILLAISLFAAWLGFIGLGRAILPLTALISITYLSAIGDGIRDPGILAYAIVIAIAALLLGRRGLIIYGTLSVVAILGIIFAGSIGILKHSPVTVPDVISTLMALIVSTIILYLNARQLENSLDETRRNEQVQIQINQELLELKDSLEKHTKELAIANEDSVHRAEQLTAIAELAHSLTEFQNLENQLPAITNFVSQRLGYYHVGIFLNDETKTYTVLRAANSEGGQKMLARGHRLRIGEEGIVGYAVKMGQPRIALDVGADSVYFDNPDLPDTRSEIALPLRLGPEFIGALDIQSTESNAFSPEDMSVFTTLADQIVIAIQNARLLYQAKTALNEVEQAYAEQTGRAWKGFLKAQSVSGYYYDGVEPKPLSKGTKPKSGFGTEITLPMLLRGQAIGNLKLKSISKNRNWTKEEVTLAEAALERAALALENTRLLEDAQHRAAKEQIISESATRVSAALDVESILQNTAEELERVLRSSEVVIQLESGN